HSELFAGGALWWCAPFVRLDEAVHGQFPRCAPSTVCLTSGLEAKLVDPVTNIALPPGLQVELWLKGPTVMKGYIGDQEATSLILDSEGWLRMGDLCYFDEDGFLFVVDRLKELIKYKGYQLYGAGSTGRTRELASNTARYHCGCCCPASKTTSILLMKTKLGTKFLLQLGNMSTNSIPQGFFDGYPDEEASQVPVAFVVRQTHRTLKESQVMEFVSNKVSNLVHQSSIWVQISRCIKL
ncbi:unnamed protein product, partial [Musa hybrid cultivar]